MRELDRRDQGRRAAAGTIEECHHLRHGGHLHLVGACCADDQAQHDPDDDEQPLPHGNACAVRVVQLRQCRQQGDDHAETGHQISLPRGLGRGQQFDADDEQDGSEEKGKGGDHGGVCLTSCV
jgi:hypothetical protein